MLFRSLYIEAPKNRKYRKTIYPRCTPAGYPLAEKLAARIEAARAEQEAGTNPLGLIFPSPAGKHWRSSNFNRNVLKRAYLTVGWRDDSGNGRWTWHSLRHVFCTTALFMTQRRHGMNSQWPLQDFLELGALAGAVPCARLHARQVLWEWGFRLGENAELLVTELVTNAVKASRAMTQAFPVRLWLASDSAQVLILVSDASPQPPVRMDTSDEAENGRGLMVVEAISEQWGWYFREGKDGKVVWATVRLSAQGISYPGRQ